MLYDMGKGPKRASFVSGRVFYRRFHCTSTTLSFIERLSFFSEIKNVHPKECLLLGGCPLLGGSFIEGSTLLLYIGCDEHHFWDAIWTPNTLYW